MKSLRRNTIKVSLGFIAGLIILYYIHDFNFVVINIIETGFFIIFYTCVDKFLDYFSIKESQFRKRNPKWFRKTYKKFNKLTKKEGLTFIGLGCLPIDKKGVWNKEASILLTELFEHEPFLEWVRELKLGVNEDE